MKTVLRITYWQPAIVGKVEAGKEGALLRQDYSAVAVGQVVAEDPDIVALALVDTPHNVEEIIVIPQRSIIDSEVLNGS